MDEDQFEDAILFEIVAMGNAVKCSAIDPSTNIEVSIIGPPNTSPYTLKMHAARKLFRRLRAEFEDDEPERTSRQRKRGVWA